MKALTESDVQFALRPAHPNGRRDFLITSSAPLCCAGSGSASKIASPPERADGLELAQDSSAPNH